MSRISSVRAWGSIEDFIFATISSSPSSSSNQRAKMFCGYTSALALPFPDGFIDFIRR